MRIFVVVALSLAGVIALLDVAAAFVVNGSVDIPFLLVLVVVVAWGAQLFGETRVDPRDLMTLHRLRQYADALARHVEVLAKRGMSRYHRDLTD